VAVALALGGCAQVLPSDGPSKVAVTSTASELTFELFPIDETVVHVTKRFHEPRFTEALGNSKPGAPVLGVGDTIRVTIWESLDAGLFTSTGGRNATIEDVIVDRQGYVFLPYGGRIKVAGMTIEQARQAVQTRLEQETLRPQVELRLVTNESHKVAVTGAVGSPGMYPLSSAEGTGKLVELITLAGGSKAPPYRTDVTVIRDGRKATVNLERLYQDPRYDIYLQANDRVVLADVPRTFSALGAISKSGQYEFTKSDYRLIDALSVAGGLSDDRANKTGVFLFRFEDGRITDELRRLAGKEPLGLAKVETVYQLDLQDPRAIFYAREFQMIDNDVIFVTNAPVHEWDKVITRVSRAAFLARFGNSF